MPATIEKARAALGAAGHRIWRDLGRFRNLIRRKGEGEQRPGDRAAAQGDPDFAAEHTQPTFADEPAPEGPDESVPRDAGGMSPRRNPF